MIIDRPMGRFDTLIWTEEWRDRQLQLRISAASLAIRQCTVRQCGKHAAEHHQKKHKTAVAKRKQIGNGQCMYKKNKIGKTEKLAETTIASIKRKTGRSATAEKAP